MIQHSAGVMELGMCWPPHLRLLCLDMFFVCKCELLHVVSECIVHCPGLAFQLGLQAHLGRKDVTTSQPVIV